MGNTTRKNNNRAKRAVKISLRKLCYPCPFFMVGTHKLSDGKCLLYNQRIRIHAKHKGRYTHERLPACKKNIENMLFPEKISSTTLKEAIKEWRRELGIQTTEVSHER